LQTAAGEQASSITQQPVLNNTINVNPSVIITSPGNGSSFTAPANITITANASDFDNYIRKVEFYNESTKLGEKTTAPYSFIWSNVPVGTYTLTAVATDNFGAVTISSAILISVIKGSPVNKPPTVSIVIPVNGSSFLSPATIPITAIASDSDGTISKVQFFNGAIKLGEITTAPYLFNWTNVTTGNYSLYAMATDNLNETTTSSSIVVHVNQSNDLNTETLSLYPNPNNGNFTIEIKNPLRNENSRISVINSAGKNVYNDVLLKNETTKQFNLFYLDSGIYLLMIVGENILVTNKFIKD